MTTIRQITALMRPLVERHDDLAIVGGRFLAIRPVHHILRGVFVDRQSDKVGFRPHWGMSYLFRPRQGVPISMHVLGRWQIDAEGIQDTFCTMVETELLPWLRSVTTLPAYLEEGLAHDTYRNALIRPEDRIFIHIAQGEFEAAHALWQELRPQWERNLDHPDFGLGKLYRRMSALDHLLLADDRTAITALLHAWEAQSVATLKIEHLWERTPFPFEEVS